jgi:multicomponent Na+:H+ antiporter subunit B
MKQSPGSPIIIIVGRIVAPFIQLFALYVIFHGHYSPGGGFQGGAMLAASVLLIRLCVDDDIAQLQFKRSLGTPLGMVGAMVYVGTGLLAMLLGGMFLDYGFLPLPFPVPEVRALGILFVELGIGLGVMSTLIAIFDDLMNAGDHD